MRSVIDYSTKKLMFAVLLLMLGLTAYAQNNGAAVDLSKDKIYYGISTIHLDTQWKWTIQDTINEYIPNTLRGQFALMDRFPHYTLSFEGAFHYMLMKEYYPQEYAKLHQYINDGRWRVAGSVVNASDTNVPSPESLFRHILYGNGFFRNEFKKTSVDIFLPDCFGFGYALPSIAAHCGLKGFSTQKLSWGAIVDIPFDIGTWEGVDGSSLVAALNPGDYLTQPDKDYCTDKPSIDAINAYGKKYGVNAIYRYFGGGDQGGAFGPETAKWLEMSAADTGSPIKFLCTGSDQLYRDLTPQQTAKLPHYNGELLMKTHGVGCYTSHAEIKRWNRKNELLADAAERAAVTADWLGGADYPKSKLKESWIRVLWHQFHDDITGTSIPQAYTFSWNDEMISQNQFAEILANSAGAVTRALNTQVKGVPVVIYNPLSISRQDIVTAQLRFTGDVPKAVRVFDPSGKEVPSQLGENYGNVTEVLFLASAPSVGYAVYNVVPDKSACNLKTQLSVTNNTLENTRYRVKIDKNGDVSSVFDKAVGKELLERPIRFELRKDNPDGFFSWEIPYRDDAAAPRGYIGGPVRVKIVEQGPARAAIEITRCAEGSTFIQRISLAAGSAGDRLELNTQMNWKTRSTLVKAAFPFTASNPNATYDLGLGTIERGNNTQRRYEVPAQQWAEITNKDGKYGVAVLNDCKYGWDKPADNVLRLSIVRNPAAGHYEGINDAGCNKLLYAVYGHKGNWQQGQVALQAARLNQPMIAFQAPKHQGPLGKTLSMLQISDSRVLIKAIKKAEDSDEIIIRLQNTSTGKIDGVKIAFASGIAAAREVTGDEQPFGSAQVTGGKLIVNMKRYQPKTFAIKLMPPKHQLSQPVCKTIDLPYNTNVVSSDGEKNESGIDGEGHAIPRELFPAEIKSEDITFKLGPTDIGAKNAVECKGQTISIEPGKYNRLYLLASVAGLDRDCTLRVDDKPFVLNMQDYTGFIGQWYSRVVDNNVISDIDVNKIMPGYVKHQPIAWVGTHRHNRNGGNDPYVFCYVFKYRVDLPKNAKTITLPGDSNIRIFAATLANNPNDNTVPAQKLTEDPISVPDLAELIR